MQPIQLGRPNRQDHMPSRNLEAKFGEGPKQSIGLAASRCSSRNDMEQESESGRAAMQLLDLDSKVRAEVNSGIHQMRTIEHQLRTAPQGFLGRADVSEALALRMTLLTTSATIVGSFSRVIGWLSPCPPNSSSFPNDNFSGSDRLGRADSPLLSTSHTHDSDAPLSQRPRVPAAATSSKHHAFNLTSPVISPCQTHHSGSGMSENSANPASPLLASDMDGDVTATATAAAAATGASVVAGASRARRLASNEATNSTARPKSLAIKRKFMPKLNCKQHAIDPAHDGPPDDGHTWRKYGQKDILGSTNPRSYYRCTHKMELGCLATKYVQRCDDEPLVFDVTYRGSHICQSVHQHITAWPFAGFPEQTAIGLNRAHPLTPSGPISSSTAMDYQSLGGNQLSSSAPQSQVANSDELLLGNNHRQHGLSPLASRLPLTGGIPSTNDISDMSRFSLASAPSTDLAVHQQHFPVGSEDANPSQPTVFDVSRLSRDGMFGNPDLLNMLLVNSRPGQNDVSFASTAEDLQSEIKRVKLQQRPMEPASSSSSSRRKVNESAESQFGARWGEELDVHYQLEMEGPIPSRFGTDSSIVISGGARSSPALPSSQRTPGERPRNVSMKGPDSSAATPISTMPMTQAFTMDEIMGYETFAGGHALF